MRTYRASWESPVGTLHFIANEQALLSLAFDQNCEACLKRLGISEPEEGENPVIAQAKGELNEYFEGRRRTFSVPVELKGSDFQKRVWEGLKSIPFGTTVSYREQARDLGQAAAVRATGSAN